MSNDKWKMIRSVRNLVLLTLTAGVPRIIGAVFVHKEPFGDAYCYIEQATMLRHKIVGGYLAIENLYGFWLPLYQFFCSIVSVPFNQPVYVSRLVAAIQCRSPRDQVRTGSRIGHPMGSSLPTALKKAKEACSWSPPSAAKD